MKSIITDFSYGELSQKIDGRVDLPAYRKGAAGLENMFIGQQGYAGKMPGTKFSAEVKDSSKKTRLVPFEISVENAYVLEFGNNYIRVFKNGDQVKSGGSAVEVVTTYAEANLFDLKYVQHDKKLYLVHPLYKVRVLTWTSDTSWAIADMAFEAGSYDFTTSGNYPSVVTIHEGRLIFGATTNFPQTIWGSKVALFTDFILGVDDNEAWEYPIGTVKFNRVLWILSGEYLIIGTSSGEVVMYGEGGITPTSIRIKTLSGYGSKSVQGKLVGLSIIFVQRSGRQVREFAYQSLEGALSSPELTILADHITESGVVDFDYQNSPIQCAWFVRADGYLIGLTYDRMTGVMAWHRHWISGEVEAVAVVPGIKQDVVYVVVKRTIDGSTKRYVEYFKSFEEDNRADWFFLHSGVEVDNGAGSAITAATKADPVVITSTAHGFDTDDYLRITGVAGMTELNGHIYRILKVNDDSYSLKTENNVPVDGTGFHTYTSGGIAQLVTSTITGLDHLEGKSVSILADGGIQAAKTVDSGSITLERKANKINVGLGYRSYIKTMRLMPEAIGDKKRISKLYLRFYKTIGCKIGMDIDNLKAISFRENELDLSAPEVFTGDKEEVLLSDYTTDGFIYLVQDDPLPCNILALGIEFQNYGGR